MDFDDGEQIGIGQSIKIRIQQERRRVDPITSGYAVEVKVHAHTLFISVDFCVVNTTVIMVILIISVEQVHCAKVCGYNRQPKS